jgi:phosphatidate cytidylyltransferase
MNNLLTRLPFAAFFISLAVYSIFFAPEWLFLTVVVGLVSIALYEYSRMVEAKGFWAHPALLIGMGALVVISVYFSLSLEVILLALVAFFVIFFTRKSVENGLASTALFIFGLIYIAWFFAQVLQIRRLPHGELWVFFTILIVKSGDAGAYFVGKAMGKNKLLEHVSPKKSIEGAWGQMITSIVLSAASTFFLPDVPMMHLLILGFSIGVLAQLSDLAESLLKRDAGVKDSGQIPGLGGILDVLDSLLFTVPFVYFYLTHLVLRS